MAKPHAAAELLEELRIKQADEFNNALKVGRGIVVNGSLLWLICITPVTFCLLTIFGFDQGPLVLVAVIGTWVGAPAAGYGYVTAARWRHMYGWDKTKEKLLILAKWVPVVAGILGLIIGVSFALSA